MNQYYRTATLSDALYVAKHMREEDRREVEGLGYHAGILPVLIMESNDPVVFYDKDRPDQIMGVAGICPDQKDPNAGVIWMLCTPHIANKPIKFIKEARKWIAESEVGYKYLWNLADARNHLHHRFLRMMGFKSLKTQHPAPYYIPYLEIVRLCAYPPRPSQQQP